MFSFQDSWNTGHKVHTVTWLRCWPRLSLQYVDLLGIQLVLGCRGNRKTLENRPAIRHEPQTSTSSYIAKPHTSSPPGSICSVGWPRPVDRFGHHDEFPWCVKSLWCEKLPANYIRYWISVRITREPSLFSVCFTWTGQHTSSLVSNELSTEAEANLFMTISTGTDTWLYLTWLPWSNKICEVICWWHVSKEGIKSVKDSLCTVNSATADAWSAQDKEARAWTEISKISLNVGGVLAANEGSKYRSSSSPNQKEEQVVKIIPRPTCTGHSSKDSERMWIWRDQRTCQSPGKEQLLYLKWTQYLKAMWNWALECTNFVQYLGQVMIAWIGNVVSWTATCVVDS